MPIYTASLRLRLDLLYQTPYILILKTTGISEGDWLWYFESTAFSPQTVTPGFVCDYQEEYDYEK